MQYGTDLLSRARRLVIGVALFAITLSADAGPLAATVPAPSIDAKSYILTDYQTGAVLAEKNADERVEPASLTKIMTVYAASHALKEGLIHLDDQVTVSKKAWKMEGSRMFLEVGKQVSVDMLLNGIVIQSGNDGSENINENIGLPALSPRFISRCHAAPTSINSPSGDLTSRTCVGDFSLAVSHNFRVKLPSQLIHGDRHAASFPPSKFAFNKARIGLRRLMKMRNSNEVLTGWLIVQTAIKLGSAERFRRRVLAQIFPLWQDRSVERSHTGDLRGF